MKRTRVPTDSEISGRLAQYLDITNGVDVPPRIREITAMSLNDRPHIARLLLGGGAVVALAAAATAVLVVAAHQPHRGPVAVGSSPSASASASARPTATPTPSATANPTPLPTPASTAGWVTVSDAAGGYSFAIPPSWRVSGPCTSPGQAPGDPEAYEVVVGPTPSGCGADDADGILVQSYAGSSAFSTPAPGASGVTATTVTVDGIRGTLYYQPSSGCISTDYQYVFFTGGRVYQIYTLGAAASSCSVTPNPPIQDLSAFMEMIVTQTWAFHG